MSTLYEFEVSIIIPFLNEEDALRTRFSQLGNLRDYAQVIFVDGGSSDGSVPYLKENGFSVISYGEGHRARQLNLGAAHANGKYLLFLHVDTYFEQPLSEVLKAISAITEWGYFKVHLEHEHLLIRLVESSMNLRTRISGIITGDHTLIIEHSLFNKIGGFPDLPLMEDIAISKNLLQAAGRPKRLPCTVITSARKWIREGILKTIVRMWTYRAAYFFGVSADRLYQLYYRKR